MGRGFLNQGGEVIAQGGLTELLNLPQSVDDQFPPGTLAEFQLRLQIHVPGLETTVRLLLEPFLGDDLLAVTHPDGSPILRVRWIRNLGPLAVAAILVSVAVIVTLLTLFVLFKFAPGVAASISLLLIALVVAGALAYGFTQRRR